jgi:uncharacterized protein (AIM24 family)
MAEGGARPDTTTAPPGRIARPPSGGPAREPRAEGHREPPREAAPETPAPSPREDAREAPPDVPPDTKPPGPAPQFTGTAPALLSDGPGPGPALQPVSPALMAGDAPPHSETARLLVEGDTLPPGTKARAAVAASASAPAAVAPAPAALREVFRGLGKGLIEVDFAGKVYIKQGTIYSYSGNLTFWVKDKRPGARPALVIVTGTGRLILTDRERDITFMQVADEPVFVDPSHLLACEEGLQPRYEKLGEDGAVEVVALEGRGMVALSVASKPLPLTVRPGLPVSVPAPSVIMWTGVLTPHVVDDPDVYEVVLPTAAGSGRLLRLEGTGRILVEQTAGA